MVIIGYQGIGKSTLCNEKSGRYIDLESGNFLVDGKRDENWAKVYANIANHLSKQGYVVFTSSHKVVRNALKDSDEQVFIIHPGLDLKDQWIKRLQERYDSTKLDKDYKALMNAKEMYEQNIQDLIDDPIPSVEIHSLHYSLGRMVNLLLYPKTYEGMENRCNYVSHLLHEAMDSALMWMDDLTFMVDWDAKEYNNESEGNLK